MRNLSRAIILSSLLLSSSSYAYSFELFAEPLYWRATEVIDWAFTNNQSTTNQSITYKTIDFDYKPGFRVGVGLKGDLDTELYFTKYFTDAKDQVYGNTTSAFLATKIAQPSAGFAYQAEQVDFDIDYNMIDWDLGKRFYVTQSLMLRPIVGISGGWIDQKIKTNLQGAISASENLKNNFYGVGPKAGIEAQIKLFNHNDAQLNLVADFATDYLWGHWTITDHLYDSVGRTIEISTNKREMGAVGLQALLGLNFDYKQFSMKFGYEINDWLNQNQIFDDATGGHETDLILQGITLKLAYYFT